MILRRILVVLFFLAKASNAAVPSLSELDKDLKQLSIKDVPPVKVSKSLLTLEEAFKQGDELQANTLNDDIETVVNKLNQRLFDLLDSGVAPLDAVPIINCFSLNAEQLVMTAQRVQAHVLLNLLQLVYIWRDDAQFHWFQALSYESEWYDEKMWQTHQMDWRSNLRAVCEWDNDVLMAMIQRDNSSKNDANFEKELLRLCAEHDAVKVLITTKINPIRLEEHLELMTNCGSVALLRLYQSNKEIKHLHLERFSLPKWLPVSVDDFVFLLSHGHDCFPMGQFIERFCREGRLDLLDLLHKLEPKLIPSGKDLILAAEKGWLGIIQWAHHLELVWQVSNLLAIKLAVNDHFKALNWLINKYKIVVDDDMITEIVIVGASKALQWIYDKQPFDCKQAWADLAAENHHLPILEWIYNMFKLLPTTYFLRNATAEILDWIRVTDNTLINASLVEHGASNLELLQWLCKNAPISIFDRKKLTLSRGIRSRNMMEWLYSEFKISPVNMDWAYMMGDLEAVQWALENCQVLPTVGNIFHAIRRGQLNIIKWLHENYPECIKIPPNNFTYGSPEIFEYLKLHFVPNTERNLGEIGEKNLVLHQVFLKWAHEHDLVIKDSRLTSEMDLFASSGQLQPFLWFVKAFPKAQPSPELWNLVASRGHHEVYEWLLENCPRPSLWFFGLKNDIQVAFVNGHLEIVKMILKKYPQYPEDIFGLEVTRSNYHIKRWLITNNIWKDPLDSSIHSWFQSLLS